MFKTSSTQQLYILLILVFHIISNTQSIQHHDNSPTSSSTTASSVKKTTRHLKNKAILLSSSVFFHNYRHTANVLAMYHTLKTYGNFTDDDIILFIADDVSCNARNMYKDAIFPYGTPRTSSSKSISPDEMFKSHYNLMQNVFVDYIQEDVTVENFKRVLLGKQESQQQPKNQQYHNHPQRPQHIHKHLNLDEDTNLLIYLTGHGGDNFFKFRDSQEIVTEDFGLIFQQMQQMKRYNEILFISDTCQAMTLSPNHGLSKDTNNHSSGSKTKNVFSIGSSLKGQSSYAHHTDYDIGHSVIDSYAYELTEMIEKRIENEFNGFFPVDNIHNFNLLDTLVHSMYGTSRKTSILRGADVGWDDRGCDRKMKHVPLSDFMVARQYQENENNDTSNVDLYFGKLNFAPLDDTSQKNEEENMTNSGQTKVADGDCSNRYHSTSKIDDNNTNISSQNARTRTNPKVNERRVLEEGRHHPYNLSFLGSLLTIIAMVTITSLVWQH